MRQLIGLLIPVCALAIGCGGGGGGGGGTKPTATPTPITKLFVRMSGNDDANGATPDSAFQTVARATQLVRPGTTIYVGAGTYSGSVQIHGSGNGTAAPIQLIADTDGAHTGDAGEVILDGNESVALSVQSAPSVSVDGFELTGVANDPVVNVISSDGFTIRNCMILETASVNGITLNNTDNALIFNNVIAVDNRGIQTVSSQNTRIISNTIVMDNAPALSIGTGSTSTTVRNNVIDSERANINISVEDTARATYDGDYNLVFARLLRPDDQASAYRPQQLQGPHDVNEDALFIDRNGDDFHLDSGSPAVDAGNGENVSTDLLLELEQRSTAVDNSRDMGVVDLGYHYPIPTATPSR